MFPSFKGLRKERQKLRDYAFKNLRGKTLTATIDNITKVIDQLDPEDKLVNFDEERFAKILLAIDNKEMLNFELDNFVEVILKSKTELAKFIKESIPNYDNVEKLKYFNYDTSKPESEQTKEALQNRLIELYKSVLLNENVIGEVMTPVDFDHFKNDIRSIVKEKPTTNLSTFNQLNDIDVKYSFLAGKAGVGQQANALMDYVLGSLGDLSITNFTVPKSNTKLDMEYSQKLSSEDLKYYAKQLKLSDDQVNKLQSIKISHSLSAILNAFVDIAKDPYITEGNWVTMTTNTGNLLLRKGVHPFYVNAFLAQPIIKEYVEFSEQYESSQNQNVSTQDAFIEQRFGKEEWDNTQKTNVLNDSLKALRSYITDGEKYKHMSALDTFFKYQSASKAIKTNIDASKFMVNGIGGSVNSLIISKNAVDSILDAEDKYNSLLPLQKEEFKKNIILGFSSKFTNPNGSESMFSKLYNNIIIKPEQIVKANPKQFLAANDTIQDTFNEISHDSKNEILLDEDLGKDLDKTFYSYIMSGFDSLHIDSSERKDLTLNFPKEFKVFKEVNKGKYTIIDEITINQGNTLEFIGLNNRKKSQDYEKLMVGSFLDLLNKDEEFTNKLIKYSYLVSGFSNNKTQFFSMIPTQWFNRNNINRYIINKSAEYNNDYKGSNDDNFINQYYLTNLENKKVVKNVSAKQMLKDSWSIHGFTLDKPGKAGYFRVNSDPMGQNPDVYYKLAGYNEEYQGVYTRFIPNINDTLSEIKPLNVKDKKGNRIINYDTEGINLKPVTETSPNLAKNIDKTVLSKLHTSAIYRRDKFYRENVIIKKDEVVNVDEVVTEDNEVATVAKSEIKGINIRSDKNNPNSLGNKLTNPNWYAKNLMDVEAPYKANASKIKAPQLNKEDALKYDMNLMYKLQVEKFKKNPELIDEINENGGLDFIKQSSHIVGVKNSRWEGKGIESNFIKVLAKSYETVAKELNKFIESEIKDSNKSQQLSLFDNSKELWNSNKTLLENNGMSEESFNQMYDEFGEDFINEYIKKCKS